MIITNKKEYTVKYRQIINNLNQYLLYCLESILLKIERSVIWIIVNFKY